MVAASTPTGRRPRRGTGDNRGVTPWTLLLPVKGGPQAKSRLGAPPGVASAIALDTLAAVLAARPVGRVVVVTADRACAQAARAAGAEVTGETRPGEGLVAAVRDGVAAVGRRRPWGLRPAAVLLADLPALRPEDLEAGLAAAAEALGQHPSAPMAVVPDADGTGTVLLAARTPAALDPAFGAGSLAEHVRRGAVRLDLDLPRLRRDVDTPADLDAALALGVGARTASALAVCTA